MSGTLLIGAAVTGVIIAVLGFAYALWLVLNPTRSASDRLQDLTASPSAGGSLLGATAQLSPMARTLSKVATPTDEDELDALKWRLIQAGFRGRNNVEMYSVTRVALTLGLPVFFLLFYPNGATTMGTTLVTGITQMITGAPFFSTLTRISWALFGTIAFANIGYYLPAIWVVKQRQKRQDEIQRFFPDALDLMCTSVEAGLAVDSAFRKVAEEMIAASALLASELLMVTREVSAGIPRVEALRNLYKRTGLEDIRSLVHVLAQAERFGTPIARSLRIHSEMVRTKRMQRAEEKAAKASPKMTVAMVFFILPSLFIILIGPAIIAAIRVLIPTITNIG